MFNCHHHVSKHEETVELFATAMEESAAKSWYLPPILCLFVLFLARWGFGVGIVLILSTVFECLSKWSSISIFLGNNTKGLCMYLILLILWHRNVGTLLLLNWYFKIYVIMNLWSSTTDPRASWSFSSLISGSDCNYSINLVSSTWLKPKQVLHGSGEFVPDYSPVVCIYLVVLTIVISILHGFLVFS